MFILSWILGLFQTMSTFPQAMWAATHIAAGVAGYELVKNEPRWFKWLYVVVWGFMTHWWLDRAAAYHEISYPFAWYEFLFIFINVIVIGLLWWLTGRGLRGWRKIIPPYIVSGFVAWLIWDLEWVFVEVGVMDSPFLHGYIGTFAWAGGTTAPKAAAAECLFMFTIALGAAPTLFRRRRKNKKAC